MIKKKRRKQNNELKRGVGTGSFVSFASVGLLIMIIMPYMVYQQGAGAAWVAIGSFVGVLMLWQADSYRLMRFSLQQENRVTLPGFFSARFQEKRPVLLGIFSVLLLLFFWLAGTALLYGMAILLEALFGIKPMYSILGITLISTGLFFLFGRAGLSVADRTIAAMIMAGLMLMNFAIYRVLGINRILENIFHSWAAGSVSEFVNVGFMNGKRLGIMEIISLFSMGLLVLGNPLCLQRFEQADRARTIHRSRRWAVIFCLLCLFVSVLTGGMLRASLYPAKVNSIPELFRMILEEDQGRGFLFHLTGILFLIAAAALLLDLLHACVLQMSQIINDNLLDWGRSRNGGTTKRNLLLCVLLSEMLVAAGALQCGDWIFPALKYALIILACGLAPVTVLSLHFRRMNAAGCLAGLFTGSVFAAAWELIPLPFLEERLTMHALTGLNAVLPAMLLGLGAGFLGAMLSKEPTKAVVDAYEEVQYRLVTVNDETEKKETREYETE